MNAFEVPTWLDLSVEERRRIVTEELRVGREMLGDLDFFSNFRTNLPCSDFQPGNGYHRKICVECELLDIKIKEFEHGRPRDRETESELYWEQTPRQFFQAIDNVIKTTGIPMKEVLDLQHQIFVSLDNPKILPTKAGLNIALGAYGKLIELTTPVYIELRVMGYTHVDLVASSNILQ